MLQEVRVRFHYPLLEFSLEGRSGLAVNVVNRKGISAYEPTWEFFEVWLALQPPKPISFGGGGQARRIYDEWYSMTSTNGAYDALILV